MAATNKIEQALIVAKGTRSGYIKNEYGGKEWVIKSTGQKIREKTARSIIANLGLIKIKLNEAGETSLGICYIFPDDIALYKTTNNE